MKDQYEIIDQLLLPAAWLFVYIKNIIKFIPNKWRSLVGYAVRHSHSSIWTNPNARDVNPLFVQIATKPNARYELRLLLSLLKTSWIHPKLIGSVCTVRSIVCSNRNYYNRYDIVMEYRSNHIGTQIQDSKTQ